MLLVLFGFWLLLNGRVTLEIALTGLVLSALLYAFIWKFMGYSPRKEWAVIRRLPRFMGFLGLLLREIFRSAFATIRLIWSPRRRAAPRLVSFRTDLRTEAGRTVLANAITLTPGTIIVDVQGERFLVHCLDGEFARGLDGGRLERRAEALEKGGAADA